MQMQIWFRGGESGQFTVDLLGRKNKRFPYCDACADLELPNEELDYSVLYAFVACNGAEDFVRELGLSALCILNEYDLEPSKGDEPTRSMPLDPVSAFWEREHNVCDAAKVADAADHFAHLLRTESWNRMQEYLLPVRRVSPDFMKSDDEVSDAEFIETITNELGLIAGHCRWFVANRSSPVLVSVQAFY